MTAVKTQKKVKAKEVPFGESLNQLIESCGLSKTFIAEKIDMPRGTFKNKLNPNTPEYKFTDAEETAIRRVLWAVSERIDLIATAR